MTTFWVSTLGNDSNSGTNYGDAKLTIDAAFGVATSQGDKVYIVNDGTHLACAFSGKKLVSSGNAGTAYGTDPGFAVIGVDPSGNPAMATVVASSADGRFYFLQTTNSADYIEVEGIFFDWTSAQENSDSEFYRIIGYNQAPDHLRIRNCRFRMVDPGDPWVDTGWWLPVAFTDAGNGTGQVEISYCFFENCGMQFGATNNQSWIAHHNVFINDTSTVPSAANYLLAGGVSYAAGNVYRFYNNTLYRKYNTPPDDDSNWVTCGSTDSDGINFHSNLYYSECGTGATDGSMAAVMLAGSAGGSQGSTSTMDYNHFGFNTNYNSTNLFSSGGYTSYTFFDTWRTAGTPTASGNTLNTNDTQTFLDIADFFNATSTWTWSTTAGYEIELPLDMRPTTGRTTAFGGGVAGAIDEAVNAPPVAGNVTYTATSGVQITVNSTNGVLSNSSDPDLDTLTASVTGSGPSHGALDTFNTTTGAFQYTANITFTGTDSFSFIVSDGTTWSNTATASITVSNNPPSGEAKFYSMTEGSVLSVTAGTGLLVNADPGDVGQTASITGVVYVGPNTLVYNTTTGAFTFTPDFGFTGFDGFLFRVTDGNTNTSQYLCQITVNEATTPPAQDPVTLIDSFPFFRPVLKGYATVSVRIQRNENKRHVDKRHYLDETIWNEHTVRYLQINASSNVTLTLGGVAETQAMVLQTDQQLSVTVVWNTDSGTDSFQATVSGCMMFDQAPISSLSVSNTSSTTANVHLTVFE